MDVTLKTSFLILNKLVGKESLLEWCLLGVYSFLPLMVVERSGARGSHDDSGN